jgi:hypothetical protein
MSNVEVLFTSAVRHSTFNIQIFLSEHAKNAYSRICQTSTASPAEPVALPKGVDRCPKCGIKARKGYYAGISAPSIPSRKPQAKPLQSLSEIDNNLIQESMLLAGTYYFDMNDIAFVIRNADKINSPNGQNQMMIELSIDPAGIEMETGEGRRKYKLQVAIFYSDKEGNVLGSNVWKIRGSLSEEDVDRARREGIPFSAKIPIISDNQILRIVLYDEIGGRMASKFTKKRGKGLL